MTHTQYTNLKYGWKLFEGDEQIGIGAFQTNALMQYESKEAFLAGDAPVKVYHKSAYMKARHQAEMTLEALRKFPMIPMTRKWGKWRSENDSERSQPLLVNGKQSAFRLHLFVNID